MKIQAEQKNSETLEEQKKQEKQENSEKLQEFISKQSYILIFQRLSFENSSICT